MCAISHHPDTIASKWKGTDRKVRTQTERYPFISSTCIRTNPSKRFELMASASAGVAADAPVILLFSPNPKPNHLPNRAAILQLTAIYTRYTWPRLSASQHLKDTCVLAWNGLSVCPLTFIYMYYSCHGTLLTDVSLQCLY